MSCFFYQGTITFFLHLCVCFVCFDLNWMIRLCRVSVPSVCFRALLLLFPSSGRGAGHLHDYSGRPEGTPQVPRPRRILRRFLADHSVGRRFQQRGALSTAVDSGRHSSLLSLRGLSLWSLGGKKEEAHKRRKTYGVTIRYHINVAYLGSKMR